MNHSSLREQTGLVLSALWKSIFLRPRGSLPFPRLRFCWPAGSSWELPALLGLRLPRLTTWLSVSQGPRRVLTIIFSYPWRGFSPLRRCLLTNLLRSQVQNHSFPSPPRKFLFKQPQKCSSKFQRTALESVTTRASRKYTGMVRFGPRDTTEQTHGGMATFICQRNAHAEKIAKLSGAEERKFSSSLFCCAIMAAVGREWQMCQTNAREGKREKREKIKNVRCVWVMFKMGEMYERWLFLLFEKQIMNVMFVSFQNFLWKKLYYTQWYLKKMIINSFYNQFASRHFWKLFVFVPRNVWNERECQK